jgi:hypothetical protein
VTGNPWEDLRRVMCNELNQQVHPAAPHRSLKGLLAHHPLVCFFLLAYALTWLAWSPWSLSEADVGLLPYDGGNLSLYLDIAALVVSQV